MTMSTFLSSPGIHKTLRYILVYALFAIFALLGLAITMGLRSDIFNVCAALAMDSQIVYLIYSWGSYLLFLPYIVVLAFVEAYFNKAVPRGQIRARALRVFAIEGGIGIVVLAFMAVLALYGYPPSL